MPYCNQCGSQVAEIDLYCAHCGARQPVSGQPSAHYLSGMTPRTAAILCYIPIIGWVGAIVVLAADKFRHNRTVRFHAFQGLYLFVAWLIAKHVLGPIFHAIPGPVVRVDRILEALILFVWIFMIVKASQEQLYSLPIIGDLAERSVSER